MNTTKKGTIYEKFIFEKFEMLLHNDELPVNSKASKVRFKPKYFSKERSKEIEFDVSIESYLPRTQELSSLTIIECKNYDNRVPVDDIEEFKSKLNQIRPTGIKGIFCTPNGFQESAYNYAKFNHIALMRAPLTSNIHEQWILPRRYRNHIQDFDCSKKIKETIINDNNNSMANGLVAIDDNYYSSYSLSDYINSIIGLETGNDVYIESNVDPKSLTVNYLNDEEIKETIQKIYTENNIPSRSRNYMQSFKSFVNAVIDERELIDNCDLGVDYSGKPIIGKISGNSIYTLDKKNFNIPRFNFTIAHEIGHLVLHSKSDWFNSFSKQNHDIDDMSLIQIQDQHLRCIEIQANIFAAELLVPDELFLEVFHQIIRDKNIIDKGFGYLFIDGQPINNQIYSEVLKSLQTVFKASKSVLDIKLIKHNFIKYKEFKPDNIYDAVRNIIMENEMNKDIFLENQST